MAENLAFVSHFLSCAVGTSVGSLDPSTCHQHSVVPGGRTLSHVYQLLVSYSKELSLQETYISGLTWRLVKLYVTGAEV